MYLWVIEQYVTTLTSLGKSCTHMHWHKYTSMYVYINTYMYTYMYVCHIRTYYITIHVHVHVNTLYTCSGYCTLNFKVNLNWKAYIVGRYFGKEKGAGHLPGWTYVTLDIWETTMYILTRTQAHSETAKSLDTSPLHVNFFMSCTIYISDGFC